MRRTQSSQDPDEAVIGHPFDAVQVIAHEQNRSSWAEMCIADINREALILDPDHPFIRSVVDNDLTEVRRQLDADPRLANSRVRGSASNLDGTIYEAFADGPTKTTDYDETMILRRDPGPVSRSPSQAAICSVFDQNPSASAAFPLFTTTRSRRGGPLHRSTTPFSALEHGRRDKADLVLEYGGTFDIFTAAMYGDERTVEDLLLEQPELVHERSPSRGRTPIEEAVNVGQLNVAQVLIDCGSEIRPETAAALGRVDDIRRHLDEEPDAIRAIHGYQPLICWAAGAGQAAMIDFLIEQGADPDQPDQWGVTPLRKASTAEVVDCLARGGADVTLNTRGFTPFSAQVSAGNLDAADTLLRHGADPNQKSNRGRTPYHWVVGGDRDFEGRLRFLLRRGADPRIPDDNGQTPLELAVERDLEEAIRILLEAIERG